MNKYFKANVLALLLTFGVISPVLVVANGTEVVSGVTESGFFNSIGSAASEFGSACSDTVSRMGNSVVNFINGAPVLKGFCSVAYGGTRLISNGLRISFIPLQLALGLANAELDKWNAEEISKEFCGLSVRTQVAALAGTAIATLLLWEYGKPAYKRTSAAASTGLSKACTIISSYI